MPWLPREGRKLPFPFSEAPADIEEMHERIPLLKKKKKISEKKKNIVKKKRKKKKKKRKQKTTTTITTKTSTKSERSIPVYHGPKHEQLRHTATECIYTQRPLYHRENPPKTEGICYITDWYSKSVATSPVSARYNIMTTFLQLVRVKFGTT